MRKTGLPRFNLEKLNKLVALAAASFLILQLFLPVAVYAATLTPRKLTLGSSATSTRTTHTFDFTTATTASIGSMSFDYCTTASGACTAPTGFDTQEASLAIGTQVGATGFTVHANTDTNTIVITRTAASLSSGTAVTMPFGTGTGSTNGPTNPSAVNTTFFARISTFTSTDGTGGATDTGVVAVSTANQISVTASIDETLTFCVAQTGITSSSCAGASGTTVALGTLTSSATGSGTSQFAVGTNAESGYAVTINGNTLTCTNCLGSPTISALGAQTASTTNTEQFGVNLRDNTTPNVGVEPDGAGSATPTANYNTVDQYRFVSTDQIASKSSSDQLRRFHVSYIANIRTDTEPGSYSSTFTYIATATF